MKVWTHITNTNQGIFWYNSDTGAAALGKLSSAGVHTTIREFTLAKGYTAIVKSGNLILLYDKNTGSGETGRFHGENFVRKQFFDRSFKTNWDLVMKADLSP